METNEKNISPEEGLHLIHTMINTARNKVSEDGFHLMFWGSYGYNMLPAELFFDWDKLCTLVGFQAMHGCLCRLLVFR
jgi:hypothetical protein